MKIYSIENEKSVSSDINIGSHEHILSNAVLEKLSHTNIIMRIECVKDILFGVLEIETIISFWRINWTDGISVAL